MTFQPKPCLHCGATSFHVIPNLQFEVWQASTAFGLNAMKKIGGAMWNVTLVVCTQCGRTETFTAKADELAARVPGTSLANSAGRQ